MLDIIIKNMMRILKNCLKSTNKELFKSALTQLSNASNQYGKDLNPYLPQILDLISKKQVIFSDRIRDLSFILISNGGLEVQEFIQAIFPHFIVD